MSKDKGKRIKDKEKKRRGQATIELTVAFMAIFVLLVASAKIFFWFSDSLANRHQAFEVSRTIHRGGFGQNQAEPSDVQDLNYEPDDIRLVE